MSEADQLTKELHDFFNRFTSWETSLIRSRSLTLSESHAIEILGVYGRMNMKSLGEKLAVTTGTVTITVDRLEKGGYARRVTQKGDRRTYIIELTPPGERAFEEHHEHHRRLTQELMPLLSEEENLSFIKILQKLNQHLF